MSKSKSRHLADLIGSDGDVKDSKMDRAAKADMSNVGTLPASVKAQLKGDIGNTGATGPFKVTTGAAGARGVDWSYRPTGCSGNPRNNWPNWPTRWNRINWCCRSCWL